MNDRLFVCKRYLRKKVAKLWPRGDGLEPSSHPLLHFSDNHYTLGWEKSTVFLKFQLYLLYKYEFPAKTP